MFWVKSRTDLRSGVREFRNGFLTEMELGLGQTKSKDEEISDYKKPCDHMVERLQMETSRFAIKICEFKMQQQRNKFKQKA